MRIGKDAQWATGLALAMLMGGFALVTPPSQETLTPQAVPGVTKAGSDHIQPEQAKAPEPFNRWETAYLLSETMRQRAEADLQEMERGAEAELRELERGMHAVTEERDQLGMKTAQLENDLLATRREAAKFKQQGETLRHQLRNSALIRPVGLFVQAYRDERHAGMWTFQGAYNTVNLTKPELGAADSGYVVVSFTPGPEKGEAAKYNLRLRIQSPTGQTLMEGEQTILSDMGGHLVFPYTIHLAGFGRYVYTLFLDGAEAGVLHLVVGSPKS